MWKILGLLAMLCFSLIQCTPVDDLEGAATGDEHHGRVQIKVYRGPDEHGHHDHFAPWGFWVKQPADDHH